MTGIDTAIRHGFHTMTQAGIVAVCKTMLDARPVCRFAGLQAGRTYGYVEPGTTVAFHVVVESLTPAKTQAMASVDGDTRRIYKGQWGGKFIELDHDLHQLAGVKHMEVVKAAVDRGLEIPPIVKRQYPALFTDIPARFEPKRVADALRPPQFQREPIGIEHVDRWIEYAHECIDRIRCERTRYVALNPGMAEDYDRIVIGHWADIDFFRWLRPLVDVDGVFHVTDHVTNQG